MTENELQQTLALLYDACRWRNTVWKTKRGDKAIWVSADPDDSILPYQFEAGNFGYWTTPDGKSNACPNLSIEGPWTETPSGTLETNQPPQLSKKHIPEEEEEEEKIIPLVLEDEIKLLPSRKDSSLALNARSKIHEIRNLLLQIAETESLEHAETEQLLLIRKLSGELEMEE